MKLLVDIGNTRLRWAQWDGVTLHPGGAAAHGGQVQAALQEVWRALPAPQELWAVNVAGEAAGADLVAVAQSAWGLAPRFVTARAAGFGIVNGYRDPERLGADRWVALIGARAEHAGPLCVADCGTALTLDLLDARGSHRGGLILPGLRLMRGALAQGTQGVRAPQEPPAPEEHGLLGRTTAEAVWGGALYALVALVDRVVADAGVELGAPPLCILTGGDAEQLAPLLGSLARLEPDLTLKGLAVVVRAGVPAADSV